MNEIITNVTLGLVFVLCAGVAFCIWPLENILRRRERKNSEKEKKMIIVEILLLAIGFALLIKGADWFVDGCSHLASSLGVSQVVIGLTIVAMGTSMPEAAVSITAEGHIDPARLTVIVEIRGLAV